MAAKRISEERLKLFGPDLPIDLQAALKGDDVPVAWVFGLPLNLGECGAYQAFQAGCETNFHRDLLKAWQVKMALVHGTWVMERFRFD